MTRCIPSEVLPKWAQHLSLTRLAIAQAALSFTFYNVIFFPKASEGHWIPVRDENGLPFFCFFKFHRITCPIQIPYNNEHIQRIRQITGRRWEPNAKRWIIPYKIATIQNFTNLFDAVHVQISPELWVESEALRNWKISGEPPEWKRRSLQQELKLRGYSRKTIKAYCRQIERFWLAFLN